jgi:hypothetical protein
MKFMKRFSIVALTVLAFLAACAPNPSTLQGYGKEMALKHQEIDRLDKEIIDLKKLPVDSTISRRIDSLENRKSREEADLIDLKRSADKPSEEYRSSTGSLWTRDVPDPKKHPIK